MSEIKFNSSTLELRESNAYRDGSVIKFPNGDLELERTVVNWVGSVNDRYYTVRIGDTLDKIAYNEYDQEVENSERYWWILADANKIDNPLDLSEFVGKNVVIPDFQLFLLTKESSNGS